MDPKIIKKILKYYNGKKIIITGHTGFKGSWLSLILNHLGARVIGISKSTLQKNSHYHYIKDIFYKEFFINLNTKLNTYKIIKSIKPDLIFNLAAQSLVIKSYKEPYLTFYDNFLITLNILESLRQSQIKINAVFITSDKSYKNLNSLKAYKEDDELGGDDPYSGSKGAIELLINSYFKSYFSQSKNIRVAVGRAGNVVGGGDWSDNRIIPDTFRSWYKEKKIVLRNPNATRPWQHVLEPLFGYLILGYKLHKNKNINGEAYNFGPIANHRSVLDLISSLNNLWNKDRVLYEVRKVKNNFKEADLLALNSNKAKIHLGWSCNMNFNETLKLIHDWYLDFKYNNKDIKITSQKQIAYYISKIKNEI